MTLRALIIGGYGTFGGRLADLLLDEARFTLIIAGRSEASARAFCAARPQAAATLIPARFDRGGDLAERLAALAPAVVVDASGPWQAYGERPYALIEACIAARLPYLDLADGSDFVGGVTRFDAAAKAAGVYVLSGVSSVPVLSTAVVRHLARGMSVVENVSAGIAPSPFAGVGLNVIRAIASYAGQRVALRRDGRDTTGYPLTETARFTIAPPGRLPLRSTLFSLVDVPDLRALPKLWPGLRSVWIGAGPRPEILHRALIAMAWLVRLRLLPALTFMAPLMHWATNHLRWGEHRGGMFVRAEGRDGDGAPVERSWHMIADGNDGPYIPSMAIAALLRRHLDNNMPTPGARAATAELELADYEAFFAVRTIVSGTREALPRAARLYRRLLGEAWETLPQPVQVVHDTDGGGTFAGRASVRRGRSPLARLVGWIMGFPRATDDTTVTVRFDLKDGTETWARSFGTGRFASDQFEGTGRRAHLLRERFGPLTFDMALVAGSGRLNLVMRGWSLLGLALPRWLAPRSTAYEHVEDGRFRFHVEIGHPFTGPIVAYDGWLAPA